ncbi:MAG: hypothetical protein JW954_07920 [Dehalococcoidaceae bacterium]|nr:hypothetical protein [Dehalococcoidaceae bacterium]
MKKYVLSSLVVSNLVPLLGILLLDWSLFSVLFFYWLESAVVGIYNIPRMLMAGSTGESGSGGGKHRTAGVLFFLVHYSGFMAGHGVFLFALFQPASIELSAVLLGFVSLGISHGVSFAVNYVGHKEYRNTTLSEQMLAPYQRIVVMHITIIALGFLISLLGTSAICMVLLVIVKIIIDLVAHFREHLRLGTYAGAQEPNSE